MDKAPGFGSGECRFESCHGHVKTLLCLLHEFSLYDVIFFQYISHLTYITVCYELTKLTQSVDFHMYFIFLSQHVFFLANTFQFYYLKKAVISKQAILKISVPIILVENHSQQSLIHIKLTDIR